jgi:DNA modification methylase
MGNDSIVQANPATTTEHRATFREDLDGAFSCPPPTGAGGESAAMAPAPPGSERGPLAHRPNTRQPRTSIVVEQVSINLLRPDPANPRRIGDAELDALERSIREFGLVQPVLARRADGTVIAGHQRLVAARRLGLQSVPVVWLDLPLEQARVLGLALNRIGGTWDDALLARLLAELGTGAAVDLSLSGFGEDEVRDLLRSLEAREKRERPESFDLDAALERATRQPRTRPGDIWRLGEHRLLCGDATNAPDIERLLAGERPAMAFLDPPYNVSLGDHGGQGRGRRRRRIANDNLDPASWEAFVRAWGHNLLTCVDGAIYVCMSCKELPLLCRVLAEEGGHWSDTIIWAKDRFTLGRADYQRSYEPIWYGWREGSAHHWCGDRDQGDVWEIARPADSPLHPTTKPLALMERAISNSCIAGDLVADLFAGSGSTLIAAERTGRRCAALELDPIYGDVIIARWESFSGEKGERIDG